MTKQKLKNRMAVMFIRILLLLLTIFLLTGCAETSAEPSDESGYAETDGENETEDTKASEEAGDEEEWEETEDEVEESIPIEYEEWDGTGTLKKSNAAPLSRMQYFQGKTYVVDKDDSVLGAPFPTVARQEGENLVEPKISYFLFADDSLFYMEESKTVWSYYRDYRCFELYVQSLKTGEVRKLADDVGEAVYQDGVIIYQVYRERQFTEDNSDVIVKQLDVETGEVVYEINLGNQVFLRYYDRYTLFYDDHVDEKYYYYYFETKDRRVIWFPKELDLYTYVIGDNIYAPIPLENGNRKIVQLYEQGEQVNRIFPKEFSGDFYASHEKIFYEEDRKVMEYNLETNETRFICELGEDEYGPHDLHDIEENGGMILLREGSVGPEDGYPIVYLYEVKDGQKKFVTDSFWTS